MPILTATYTRNIEIDQFDCFPAIDIAIDMPMIADYADYELPPSYNL